MTVATATGGKAQGRFITLEGGEGVGKSTQLVALKSMLEARGITVIATREPGGSAGAEAIRQLVLHHKDCDWSARSEALLFAAARADHVEKTIRPALARGEWVLCDRFVDSTRAYQGQAGSLSDGEIMTLHRIGCGGLLPDRTILLAAASSVSQQRRSARNIGEVDRFEGRDLAFHHGVVAIFEKLAAAEPERFRRVDASGSIDTVSQHVFSSIADLLP